MPEADEEHVRALAQAFRRLTAPARRALHDAGFARLDRLRAARDDELLKLHALGPTGLARLRQALRELDSGVRGDRRPSAPAREPPVEPGEDDPADDTSSR